MAYPVPKRSPNYNKEGFRVELVGYVTQLICLINKSPAELELSLGFKRGRLSQGWALYVLLSGVGSYDFIYQGRTRNSGGKGFDRDATEQLGRAGMINVHKGETAQAMRVDQMRYSMYRTSGNESAFDTYMSYECAKLNQRTGPNRIAKCVPLAGGNVYPDAPGNGVAQWELVIPKEFLCVAVMNPGQAYLTGGQKSTAR